MTITTHVDEADLPRRLLNITELADFLVVNTRHVRRLVTERRIPFIKWGYLIRFDPSRSCGGLDGHRRRPDRSA